MGGGDKTHTHRYSHIHTRTHLRTHTLSLMQTHTNMYLVAAVVAAE